MKQPLLQKNNLSFFLLGTATAAIAAAAFMMWQEPSEMLLTPTSPNPTTKADINLPAYATPSATAKNRNDQIVLELFNPSDQSLTHQLNKTNLSQQIEQALTISFMLTKCGKLSQDEYRDAFRALSLYAQTTHLATDGKDAETLVRHIAESSGASYSLIYSRLSCNSPQLPILAAQLRSWTEAVITPSP